MKDFHTSIEHPEYLLQLYCILTQTLEKLSRDGVNTGQNFAPFSTILPLRIRRRGYSIHLLMSYVCSFRNGDTPT